jgi:translation initiation factor 1A
MYRRPQQQGGPEQLGRVRTPQGTEVLGIVEAMLGNNKIRVRCSDDKIRMGRIPGKMRKRIWIHEGEVVIIEPWKIQGDSNGDVIWKYTAAQVDWLKRRGILKMEV